MPRVAPARGRRLRRNPPDVDGNQCAQPAHFAEHLRAQRRRDGIIMQDRTDSGPLQDARFAGPNALYRHRNLRL